MKLSEMIKTLLDILDARGDLPVLLTSKYAHHEIKWIDYYEKRPDQEAHVCVRMKDETIEGRSTTW